jgi:hypothetical protein
MLRNTIGRSKEDMHGKRADVGLCPSV